MAKTIIEKFVSDLSGEDIQPGHAVTITLSFADGRRNKVELDATEEEVASMVKSGREIKRRGRRPGTKNVTPDPK